MHGENVSKNEVKQQYNFPQKVELCNNMKRLKVRSDQYSDTCCCLKASC